MINSTELEHSSATHSPKEVLADVSCLLLIRDEFEREGLRGLLQNRGIGSVKSISSSETALETAARLRPNVLIAIAGNSPDHPIDLVVSIREVASISGVVVLCNSSLYYSFLPSVGSMSDIGGVGVKLLPRSMLTCGDRVMTAVNQVLKGHNSIEQEVMDALVLDPPDRSGSLAELLTKRELQVLEIAASGAGNRRIGDDLGITSAGVGNYFTRIFSKLGFGAGSSTNRRVLACREYFLEYGYPKRAA